MRVINTRRLAISIFIATVLITLLTYGAAADVPESLTPNNCIYKELSGELIDNAVDYGKYNANSSYLSFAKDWNTAENGGIVGNYNKVYAICKTPYFVLADAARTAVREGRELSQEEIKSVLNESSNRLVFMVKFHGYEINFFDKNNFKAVIKQGDKIIYASSYYITVFNNNTAETWSMPVYNAGGSFGFDISGLDYSQNFDFYLIPIEGPKIHFPIYVSRIH